MKTIYLVAPSFGCTDTYKIRLDAAIKNLKKEKLNIIKGKNIYLGKGIVSSNTPALRGKEINDAFLSDADTIISVGGGELMIEMLEYVDFDIIKNNPKTFMGFSDNTNLTYTIATNLEIETIYGVNAPSFDIYPFEYDALDAFKMLNGEKIFKSYGMWQREDLDIRPIHPYKLDTKSNILSYNYEKPVRGRIIGGCLDCLTSLCGTKFDNTVNYMKKHKNEGIIFFMEACDFNTLSLRRALIQLKYAGWFDNVDMFLIGRSRLIDDNTCGLSMNEMYLDILKDFNKPIILGADLGHLSPTTPIKVGGLVEITYDGGLTYKYE